MKLRIFDITKEFVLDRVTQEQIFESFLNIKIDLDAKYKSPFRANDKNESCSFKYNGAYKLKFKDFGNDINCDCFELVGILHGINVNHKEGFIMILKIIAMRFNLIDHDDSFNNVLKKVHYEEAIFIKKVITPEITDFKKEDIAYWAKGNVSLEKLKASRIFKCKRIFSNNDIIYVESYRNPAYLYIFTTKDFRIYFPKSQTNKFLTNSNCIQGADLLPYKQDFVVVNKSFKDAVSLSTFFLKGMNIESFGLASENTILTESQIAYLKSKYKYILTLTDYDPTGLHCAWVHRKKYGTIPLFIKNETWNSGIKYDLKDFWDLVCSNGVEKTQEIINLIYNKLKTKHGK